MLQVYKATCSKFAGNAQISVLELANSFHQRKALRDASVVPGALDVTTLDSSLDARLLSDRSLSSLRQCHRLLLNTFIRKRKKNKKGRQTKSMIEGI